MFERVGSLGPERLRVSALTIVALLASVGLAGAVPSYLPVIEPASSFSLVDISGKAVTSAELRGKVVLLSFIYTHCTTECPMVTSRFGKIADRLKWAGLLGGSALLVSVSFDPQRDTPRWLATYAQSIGADPTAWLFLTGDARQIAGLLESYRFYARRERTGDFDHVSRVYLIDQAGRIRQIYSTGFLNAEVVVHDIMSLIDEDSVSPPGSSRETGIEE